MAKTLLIVAALSGFMAVALGAFGAHGLRGRLSPEMMSVFQTGVQYHFYHTLALLGVAILLLLPGQLNAPVLVLSGLCFIVGTLLFSGSLYLLAITELRWLGAITPLGGVAFLVGWLALTWCAVKLAGT
jgi:uncharacterized membrane protein YgdD (TMEM256/DUF423 family)